MSIRQESENTLGLKIEIIGWSLTLIVPFLVYIIFSFHQIDWWQEAFLVIFSSVLVFWIFKLVPYLVPTFLLIAACLLLNIVPQNIILSGFSSQCFILVLFFSFLSAIIIKSGIFLRPLYWILSKIPSKLIWLQSVFYFLGFILSPITTIQTNRLDVTVPACQLFLAESKLFNNEPLRKALLTAVYAGSIYFSELFLTGKSANLAIFEMLPKQIQIQFNWSSWFLAAIVPVLIMNILLCILYSRFFHTPITFELDRNLLKQKMNERPPFSLSEWVSLFGILLFFIGIVLTSLNIMTLSWFCLAVLFFLLLFPTLNRQDVRTYINWPFLIYLAALIGIANSIQYLELNTVIANMLPAFTKLSLYKCILFIFFICMISTWLLGTITSIILLFPILQTFSLQIQLNPWIMAFVILVACEAWIFPYQSFYQTYFKKIIKEDNNEISNQTINMNLLFIPCRLIGILFALGYWKFIGMI